jgi:hypothetical protein
MKHLILALAFSCVTAFAQQTGAADKPVIDPGHNKALDNAIKRLAPSMRNGLQVTTTQSDNRCFFIVNVPVKPQPDKGIIRELPKAPPVDNMPLMKPGPICPLMR